MNLKLIDVGNESVAEVSDDSLVIGSVQDALDLLANASQRKRRKSLLCSKIQRQMVVGWGNGTVLYSSMDNSDDQTLTPEQLYVMRQEGTERPGSSPLNFEKRDGTYRCASCGAPLFTSATKYESGSGWPSFFKPIEGALETKTDYKILVPRTEYHCAACGAHQGHVFDDGPDPTGLRYCNNGVALTFVPDEA